VYESETGFYYLNSRYYDPETGRFINADGYVSTGQGILGNNMFAYCGNNSVVSYDTSGQMYERSAGGGFAYAGGAAGGGGCFPVNEPAINATPEDALGTALTIAITGLGVEALREEQFSIRVASRTNTKAIDVANSKGKIQAYFPINPYDFHPKGLEMKVYVNIGSGKNGGIIKWFIPGTRARF